MKVTRVGVCTNKTHTYIHTNMIVLFIHNNITFQRKTIYAHTNISPISFTLHSKSAGAHSIFYTGV